MAWVMSAKESVFDHASYFSKYDTVDWKQSAKNIHIGDIVYIYCSGNKYQKIMYKCKVLSLNFSFADKFFDNYEFWNNKKEYEKSKTKKHFRLKLINKVDTNELKWEKLLEHGLNGRIQGPRNLSIELLEYIDKYFQDTVDETLFVDLSDEYEYHEGHIKTVKVNAYERSADARKKCLEYHGVACKICNMDFGKKYGKLGEGFIHVHHLKPLHSIGQDYVVNYKNDLIPVCPNCHSMIHRIKKHESMTVVELRKILGETND